MPTTTDHSELEKLEEAALAGLAEEEGRVEADLDAAADQADESGDDELEQSPVRLAIAVGCTTIGAAIMTGGVFTGVEARVYAAVAGILGILVALAARKVRSAVGLNAIVLGGLFGIGLLFVVPTGIENVPKVVSLASEAAKSGDVLRPPVPFVAGWHAIIGWLMATVGFAAAWLALVLRRPALALLLPLPVAAIGGISVPDSAQVPSGIAVLVLFAIALGVLSSAANVGDDDERPPIGFEIRRALRALPLVAVITVALGFLAQADFLFPDPYIDPAQEPQRPKTTPLADVPDRVLFSVQSSISGPWRIGSLDVYDGEDWRLPPFAESELTDVPESGIVDDSLPQGVRATFRVAGLEGAVLPTLPNTVGIVAKGPKLAYDARNGNIRVTEGQVTAGLEYTVTAAKLPNEADLRQVTAPIPRSVRQFTEIPDPPAQVQALLDEAKAKTDNRWDEFNYLRTWILDNVTAKGAGTPVSISPDRVADLVAGTKEGSPFEIVAAQAMLARWVGVPARIGYGFDGGEQVGDVLQVRPKHGATFVEVYFPQYKWLPVIGTPKQAEPSVGGDASLQQFDPSILPSEDVSVQVFLPIALEPAAQLGRQVLIALAIIIPIALLILAIYTLWPALRKARVRSRKRNAAALAGSRMRTAAAYAEWRDFATDFGFRHKSDTPLMFLERMVPDPEHTELAWLVTRTVWGDLRDDATPDMATKAEDLSRSLRRRLASAQPTTVRAVALVSRLSLRNPYAPELPGASKKEQKEEARALVAH